MFQRRPVNLLQPEYFWSRKEVLTRPSPVPKESGVYAWYFRDIPPSVPTHGCIQHKGLTLLYVGIAPKAPPANGASASRQRLAHRIRYHYRGNAAGSTLRLTLGCLLAEPLNIALRRVGSGGRLTFGSGEGILSDWMQQNAFVTWQLDPEPWRLEEALISRLSLPLNLDMNKGHPFHAILSDKRSKAKAVARRLPIVGKI